MKKSKAVGIDLGHINCRISMVSERTEEIICYESYGCRSVPSVVAFDAKTNTILVGSKAFARRGTKFEPVGSIKRHMGDKQYSVTLGNRSYTAAEVSKEILVYLKDKMQEYLNKNPQYQDYIVDRAVITVPAYFHQDAIDATREAGMMAGLDVKAIVEEPVAAVMYYCRKYNIKDGIFMVYDLGRGNFDVSIVRKNGCAADVLGIAGDSYLGGDDFDTLLAKHLEKYLVSEGYVLDLDVLYDENDKRCFTRLKLAAENIKKELSDMEDFYCDRSGIFRDKEGAEVNLAITVTRQEFEEMIAPLLQKTFDQCDMALKEAGEKHGVTLNDIDAVLLAGGSTHIPFVQASVRKKYCDPSLKNHTKQDKPLIDEPDMAVGFGAAIAASTFGNIEIGSKVFVAEFNTSGETLANICGVLIAKGISLPPDIKAKVKKADGGFCADFTLPDKYECLQDGDDEKYERLIFSIDNLPSGSSPQIYKCCFYDHAGTLFDDITFDAGYNHLPLERTYSIEVSQPQRYGNIGECEFTKALEPLLGKGTELPAREVYWFKPIDSHVAALRFFEDSTCIKTVLIEFEGYFLPETLIRLDIFCDSTRVFHIHAACDGKDSLIVFEAAPLPLPTAMEITQLLAKGSQKAGMLNLFDAELLRLRINYLAADIQHALDEQKTEKAAVRFRELSMLVETEEDTMVPKRFEFNQFIIECELLAETSKKSTPEISARIQELKKKGNACFDSGNQSELIYCDEELRTIQTNLDERFIGRDCSEYPAYMICTNINRIIIDKISDCDMRNCQIINRDKYGRTEWIENYFFIINSSIDKDRMEAQSRISWCMTQSPPDEDAELGRVILDSLTKLEKWERFGKKLGSIGISALKTNRINDQKNRSIW